MTDGERNDFETIPHSRLLPEIGSRAFNQLLSVQNATIVANECWTVIQEGRYRYVVARPESPTVRIVLSEYLAVEVVW